MSWQATGWAKRTRGHRGISKLILLILADYYDDERGYAYPSQARLIHDSEKGRRTVQEALGFLEQAGFLTVIQRGNQYQTTKYALNMDCTDAYAGAEYCTSTSESAETAPAPDVKAQVPTSEGAGFVGTSRQEEQASSTKPSMSPLNGQTPPDWEPLSGLTGFRPPGERQIELVSLACQRFGVTVRAVTEAFAKYWPEGQIEHNWKAPVAALVRTREIQARKVSNGRPKRNSHTDRSKYAAEKKRRG